MQTRLMSTDLHMSNSSSTRLLAALAFGVAALAVVFASCAAEPTPTPVPPTLTPVPPTPTPVPPTAAEVVAASQDAMSAEQSAWFELTQENGYLPVSGVQVSEMEGAVSGEGVDITAGASLGRLYIELQIIIVDGKLWVTNPLTGNWEDLTDPEQPIVWSLNDGINEIFDAVIEPEFIGESTGNEPYRVGSDVPATALNALFFESVTSTGNVYLEATIDRESLLVDQMTVQGSITSDDTWDTERTLTITRYGEEFTIEAPQ